MNTSIFINPKELEFFEKYLAQTTIDKKFIVRTHDRVISIINPELAAMQDLTDERISAIAKMHLARFRICTRASRLQSTSKKNLRILFDEFTANEYALQEAWGFEKDASYHSWWEFPHCTCPKLDNAERKGTKYQIHNPNCPIHGELK